MNLKCGIKSKVRMVLIATNGLSNNNLVKHKENGNISKVQEQIKRGSVKVYAK